MKIRGFEIAKGWEDKDIHLPRRGTQNAAGYDIEAAADTLIPAAKQSLQPTLVPTGLKVYCQPDEFLMIANRSSMPLRGLVLANGIGVIDTDFYGNTSNDGHFSIMLFNITNQDILVRRGERIAQAIFRKYLLVDNDTADGERQGGFGSTNTKSFVVIYDCDDVLWPLTKRLNDKFGINEGKQTCFKLDEDTNLNESEKSKLRAGFVDPDNFRQMNFYPEVSSIEKVAQPGVEIIVNSNSFSTDIIKLKRSQLQAAFPFIPPKNLHLNLVTPNSNRKTISREVFAFVDDSPYNIAESEALLNLVPQKPWNINDAALNVITKNGGKVIRNWQKELHQILEKSDKYIIFVKDVGEANKLICEAIKLKKEQ